VTSHRVHISEVAVVPIRPASIEATARALSQPLAITMVTLLLNNDPSPNRRAKPLRLGYSIEFLVERANGAVPCGWDPGSKKPRCPFVLIPWRRGRVREGQ
jgi:hypothetical protein